MSDGNRYGIKTDQYGLVVFQEVQRVTRMSASTIKRRIKDNRFPPPVPGPARPRWAKIDIENHLKKYQIEAWKPWQPPS